MSYNTLTGIVKKLFAAFIGKVGNGVKQGKIADGTEAARIMRKKILKSRQY